MSALRAEPSATAAHSVQARIAVEDERWTEALPDVASLIEEALAALVSRLGMAAGLMRTELGVTLADDEAVRALNAEWRGKDAPTNILSFPLRVLEPGDAPGPMLGDLVLAFETLAREARDEGKTVPDHFRHLVIHGTLHCLGYDHETETDATRMETLEIVVLADLGIGDPYREPAEEEPARA